MKKTINGTVYDTENATRIGDRQQGKPTQITHLKESLYQTPRSGRYFLAGKSGPFGPYAAYLGHNTYGPGEGIRPITKAQAASWMEHYM